MNLFSGAAAISICTFVVSLRARSSSHSAYVSRSVPDGHVLLVPELQGGEDGGAEDE